MTYQSSMLCYNDMKYVCIGILKFDAIHRHLKNQWDSNLLAGTVENSWN